jgi:hypothetical protein
MFKLLNLYDMKTKYLIPAIFVISGLFLASCNKDDETIPRPEVNITELGYENSYTGFAGGELHIEADIVAEGKIDKITIEIHPKGEHEKSLSMTLGDGEWEVDTTYTEFSGLKNTTFHKHIDIPEYADTGHYHFHFIVTDMEGQQTTIEEELEIQLPDDAVAPEINVTGAPATNQVFNNGQTISISGAISDDKASGGGYIGLIRADQNLTDAEVNATNNITILHTHDFDNPVSHSFNASITVGSTYDNNIEPKEISGNIAWQSAEYYILVKCPDAFGGNLSYSSHYPILIQY